jgi:hypothetical protein
LIFKFWIATWETKDFTPNDSKHSLTSFSEYIYCSRQKWLHQHASALRQAYLACLILLLRRR